MTIARRFMARPAGGERNVRRFWKEQLPALAASGSKNLRLLLQIMLVIQPATAEVERGFSAMNYIKDLMRVAINGPSLERSEEMGLPALALEVWNAGKRMPQRSSHRARPRRAKQHTMPEESVVDGVSGIAIPI